MWHVEWSGHRNMDTNQHGCTSWHPRTMTDHKIPEMLIGRWSQSSGVTAFHGSWQQINGGDLHDLCGDGSGYLNVTLSPIGLKCRFVFSRPVHELFSESVARPRTLLGACGLSCKLRCIWLTLGDETTGTTLPQLFISKRRPGGDCQRSGQGALSSGPVLGSCQEHVSTYLVVYESILVHQGTSHKVHYPTHVR